MPADTSRWFQALLLAFLLSFVAAGTVLVVWQAGGVVSVRTGLSLVAAFLASAGAVGLCRWVFRI